MYVEEVVLKLPRLGIPELMLRMICDTTYILDHEDRTSPKVEELERILEECLTEREVKVVLFSEWERMLELVRDRLRQMRIGYAWHTGGVPQQRRRAEIRVFRLMANRGCANKANIASFRSCTYSSIQTASAESLELL
jgi:hypothetical protein